MPVKSLNIDNLLRQVKARLVPSRGPGLGGGSWARLHKQLAILVKMGAPDARAVDPVGALADPGVASWDDL